MSKRKPDGLFGTALVPSSPQLSTHGRLAPFNDSRSLSREEKWTTEAFHQQTLEMDAQRTKVVFAITKVMEIHQHGATEFNDTVGCILELKNEVQDPEQARYLDEWVPHQIKRLAGHVDGLIEIGATNIAQIAHRSLQAPAEPEPRGIRGWLRGR